jgi:hypothetical protein
MYRIVNETLTRQVKPMALTCLAEHYDPTKESILLQTKTRPLEAGSELMGFGFSSLHHSNTPPCPAAALQRRILPQAQIH